MTASARPLWPPAGDGVVACRMQDLLALEATGARLARGARGRQPEGFRRSMRLRARGMEYAESRPYQTGDDVRSIDWRVTARTARTHTKLFEEERECPAWLCVDLRSTMRFGTRNAFKSVFASHVAALLAWAALARGDRIGCACWTDAGLHAVPPRRGRAAATACLALLVRSGRSDGAATSGPASAGISFTSAVSATGAGARVWVLSDFMGFTREQLPELALLGRRHRLMLAHTIDPLEEDPPPIAGAWLVNAAGRLVSFDANGALAGQSPARRVRERLLSIAGRPGVELASVHTSESPEAAAQRLLNSNAIGGLLRA